MRKLNIILLLLLLISCHRNDPSDNQKVDEKAVDNKTQKINAIASFNDSVFLSTLPNLTPVFENDSNRFMWVGKLKVDSTNLYFHKLIWNIKKIDEMTFTKNHILKFWFTKKIAETDSTLDYGFYFIIKSTNGIVERLRFRIDKKSKKIRINTSPTFYPEEYMTIKEWENKILLDD